MRSKGLEADDLEAADIIVNMTGRPDCALFQDRRKVEDWNVEDPYGASAETYQRVFEDIESRVGLLIGRVRRSVASGFTARESGEKSAGQR